MGSQKQVRRPLWIGGVLWLAVLALVPGSGHADAASPRRIYPDTALVRAGGPAAWVVYPSQSPLYRELAEKIAAAVKAKTGVALPLLPDTEVTEPTHPVLLAPYRNRNLILLGRLGINRAIWGVYNRFLCAEDGYYPGGTGYVVRTAANVYKNGANTIVAGGSSETGAVRAVDKLMERITAQSYKEGLLVLPWLLDVELDGDCRKVFDADERRQMARDFNAEGGHEDVKTRRFYENIMSYTWSGRESYLKLGLRFLDVILGKYEQAEMGFPISDGAKVKDLGKRRLSMHYDGEFFVRAYDMIDDSGRLTSDQIRTTDQALIDTSYRCYGHGEREPDSRVGLQQGDALRPLDEVVTADHQNASWLADKVLSDFILETIPETTNTTLIYKEARERRAFYIKLFDALIAERWRGCIADSACTTVPTMTYFRYALEMERYPSFFDSGNARKAALYHLARVSPSGLDIGLQNRSLYAWTEFGLFVGIAASYDHDGELKAALDAKPGMAMGHYGCYLNGVHTYRPGAEVPAVEPASLTGATVVPLQPVHYRRLKSALPYEKTFDLATIRNGFLKTDDYLLLSGGQDLPANTIVTLATTGRTCLAHTGEESHFDQNALYISRLSKLNLEHKPAPPLARLDHAASAPSGAFISSTLPGYAGTDWNRQIVRIPGQFFVIFDKVTALEPDKYLIIANWRPNFYVLERRFDGPGPASAGRLEGGRWVVRDEKQEFVIAVAGNNLQAVEDADVNPVTHLAIPVYRQRTVASLKQGESVNLANLMFTRATGSTLDYELRQTADGGLLVRAAHEQDRVVYIGPLPASLGESDAPLVVLCTNRLTAFNAGTLKIQGKVWADHEPARTREIGLDATVAQKALLALWNAGTTSSPTQPGGTPRPADIQGVPQGGAKPPAEPMLLQQVARQDNLVREWRYTGAQQPELISGAKWLGSNTWDLGRIADLSKISVMLTADLSYADQARGAQASESGNVHSQILISAEGTPQTFKPFRGNVVDIAVPVMQGYGRITKQDKGFQVLKGEPQKARYVRVVTDQALTADHYLFYDAGRPDEQGEPLRARVVELRKQGRPDILVYPNLWPGFRRVARLEHDVAALDRKGRELWRHEMKWRAFFVRALDWNGDGRKEVFVGSLDNTVSVYDGGGTLTDTLTVEGRIKPADGYPLADNIGLWQPDRTGRRKLILPRYVRASFLERDGRVEGTACLNDYWVTDVLDRGLDYTGDGVEDSVAMATSHIFPLTQKAIGGQAEQYTLPYSLYGSVSGSPTLAFHLYGQGTTTLFVARQNMVALFDLKNRKWLMSWGPGTPIAAAVALPEQRQILCYTREGILWRIKLDESLAVTGLETVPVSAALNRFAVLDRKLGTVAASSSSGLFRIDPDNALTLLAPGSFVDIDVYPSDTAAEKIIAVDRTGAVESYRFER